MAGLTPLASEADCVFGIEAGPNSCKSEPEVTGSAGASPSNPCPQCGSKKLWRDGQRYSDFGFKIQRWLCRDCGLRFSDPADVKATWKMLEQVETVHTKTVKRGNNREATRQIRVRKETKNLDPEESSIQKIPEKLSEINSNLLQFAWTMKQQNYAEETIRMSSSCMRALRNRGANLNDPISVKTALALEKKWSQSRRRNVINAYTLFLRFQGLTWEKPICNVVRKYPFIPTEQEIDDLIAGNSNKVATFLQLLKETAMRSGEAKRVQWIDLDSERRIIVLNEPEKNSLPRIWNISPKLVSMLNAMPKKSTKIFGEGPINSTKTTFLKARKRLATKIGRASCRERVSMFV
jgi:integrase